MLRTDRGDEFTSVEFAAYCADQGVVRHHTVLYSPQQNGVVEQPIYLAARHTEEPWLWADHADDAQWAQVLHLAGG